MGLRKKKKKGKKSVSSEKALRISHKETISVMCERYCILEKKKLN